MTHMQLMLSGVGDQADCCSFLLNRQGMAHQGRRQGRIVGGILEILDQVMTDLD